MTDERALLGQRMAGDWFGFSVAISGSTAVVGSPFNDPDGISNAGGAYVFAK